MLSDLPPAKYQCSPPRSVLLLLAVELSPCHHLWHKQSDHASIHPSNQWIHILLPCYASHSRVHQATSHQVDSVNRMNVLEKLSSFSDYITAQTFPWFYPLYSHGRRHRPTEGYCKFPRPLVPSCVTVSSLKLFHLFLLGLTPLCKSEIAAKKHRQFSAKFPVRTRALGGCNLSILLLFFWHHVKI